MSLTAMLSDRRRFARRRLLLRLGIYLGVPALLLASWFGCMYGYRLLPLPRLAQYNKGENGIWLSRRWMREPMTAADEQSVRESLREFRRRGIRYLFPHCCPMDEKGHLPAINDDTTSRVVRLAAEHGDFFRIMPWVGGSIATVDLSDSEQRATWLSEVAQLVERYDFPGVNVNIEPLAHGDMRIFAWIDELRNTLGQKRVISFCGIRPEDDPGPGDSLGVWTADDYAQLAGKVEQIAVMSYDSGRRLPFLFVRWSGRQLWSVMNAVRAGGGGHCRLLWGIPVYEDRAEYFDPRVENIRTALHGLRRGLVRTGDDSTFQGVCIYANWTAGASEWADYDRSFLGAK